MTAHKLKWITFPIVTLALSATFLSLSPADSATLEQVNITSKQTLTNKTLTAPVLSGTVTGTYTLAGTPTITSPLINGTIQVGNPLLFGYPDNATLQISADLGIPTLIRPMLRAVMRAKGDNTTFIGGQVAYFEARDPDDVTTNTKGVLYGLSISVVPLIACNNVPNDDVDGLTVMNSTGIGGAKATDALYIAHNFNRFPSSSEWATGLAIDANVDKGIQIGGRMASYGIDLYPGTYPTSVAIRLKNATSIASRNNSDTGDAPVLTLDASNIVVLGGANVSGTSVRNWFGTTAPTTQSGATYTVGFDDNYLTFTGSGCTVTLPAAGSFSGRILTVRTTVAFTVISASSNVVPLIGGSAGTAILQATAGKWAKLVSDGTVWQIMEGN